MSDPIQRWRDGKQEGPEGRAGELLRSVRTHEPSSDLEDRVQAVLRGEKVSSRLVYKIPALAAVAGFLFLAGGATAATMIYRAYVAPEPDQPKPVIVKKHVPPPPPNVEIVEAPPPPPVEVVETPPAPPPKRPKIDRSAIAIESQKIKVAVDALRSGDATRALEELEAYERAHPNGMLRREAMLSKVSALVALDRESDALTLLEGATLDDHPRSLELTVLRGELKIRADRCTDAIADFEAALAKNLEEKLRSRAENGLSRCRVQSK